MKINLLRLLVVFFVCVSLSSVAQVRLPVSNNGLRTDLQKVIDDYSKQFAHIKGDMQAQNPQTVDYASQVQLSGSEECLITQYSGARPIYSFQAVMLTTEDFEEATKKYKWLYNQLKGMTIRLNHDYTFSLAGDYEAPDESRKFTSCIMHLLPAATNLPKLKVEVTMQFAFPEWKVNLLVYEREREDNERGKLEEDAE
jgi:hypothetical protein